MKSSKPASVPDGPAGDPTGAVRRFMEARLRWFSSAVGEGADALEVCREHSAMIDGMVKFLFKAEEDRHSHHGRTAVLALGGYGREEMGLASDIDILFLHESASDDFIRGVTDAILYPFWNNGVEIGGATRTLDDCRSMIESDAKALTAMMDARLVCGDISLYNSLMEIVKDHFASPAQRRKFIEAKIGEHFDRLGKFGDSIYLLQPNVKEGEGGLRDYHTLLWVSRAADPKLAASEAAQKALPDAAGRAKVDAAFAFIWRVRHALHLIEGKKADRLSDSLQRQVALFLGFVDADGASAEEELMSFYYRHAMELHLRCRRAMERIRFAVCRPSRGAAAAAWFRRRLFGRNFVRTGHGTFSFRRGSFRENPLWELLVFSEAKRRRLPLDTEAKEVIASRPVPVDDAARAKPAAGKTMREIFSGALHLDRTLWEMHECGLLTAWFPEMKPMMYRIQHDGYHFYTAGTHSIRAVGELGLLAGKKGLRNFPVAAKAISEVRRPHVLLLATLFHDVGKGRGGDHAEIGAKLAEEIALRIGCSGRDAEDVAFLVRSHLLMAMLAFRRDVCDEGLVERFAQSNRSPELLAMLYLLTFADLRAIGPNVWSEWKGGLLAELYQRAEMCLAPGGMNAGAREAKMERQIEAVRRSLGADFSVSEIREFLAALPERYAFSTDSQTIAAHIVMARGIELKPVATVERQVPGRGCTEFSVVTRDAPGLFARMAGALTANGANILEAQLYTTAGGLAIDLFLVTDAVGQPLEDAHRWEKIRADLTAMIAGGEDVDRIVGGRFKRRLLGWSPRQHPPEILVDNDVSAIETVVEISADDRRGLLYTIASAFHELSCTIERAKITTHVDRVIDVFYIKKSGGGKVVSPEEVGRLRGSLFDALEE
ncbi:MAG: [protein-PII] uridylyltransferase [Pseudomonadota bacterium]